MLTGLLGCRTPAPPPPPTDATLERVTALARGAYAAGSLEEAAGYYRQALARAQHTDDAPAVASAAYNLAACLLQLDRLEEAPALLAEARAEFKRAGQRAPEVELLTAKLARLQGQPREAQAITENLLPTLTNKHDAPLRLQCRLLLADLACGGGDATRANDALRQAEGDGLADAAPTLRADADLIRARLLALDQRHAEAAARFATAAEELRLAARYGDMASALEAAGAAYEVAGDAALAVACFHRAARCLLRAGQSERAATTAAHALALAGPEADPDLRRRLEQLQAESAAAQTPLTPNSNKSLSENLVEPDAQPETQPPQ